MSRSLIAVTALVGLVIGGILFVRDQSLMSNSMEFVEFPKEQGAANVASLGGTNVPVEKANFKSEISDAITFGRQKSFSDWLVQYRNSGDEELKERNHQINLYLEAHGYISKANQNQLSEQERKVLIDLIREQNAISSVQMERLSDELQKGS